MPFSSSMNSSFSSFSVHERLHLLPLPLLLLLLLCISLLSFYFLHVCIFLLCVVFVSGGVQCLFICHVYFHGYGLVLSSLPISPSLDSAPSPPLSDCLWPISVVSVRRISCRPFIPSIDPSSSGLFRPVFLQSVWLLSGCSHIWPFRSATVGCLAVAGSATLITVRLFRPLSSQSGRLHSDHRRLCPVLSGACS